MNHRLHMLNNCRGGDFGARRAKHVVSARRTLAALATLLFRLALIVSLTACAAVSGAESDEDDDAGAGGSSDLLGGNGGNGASPLGGVGDNCSEGNTDVFVISKQYDLYRFSPETLSMTLVGPIVCPQGGDAATPFSMSVDRQGQAWVLFNNGKLYKVSIGDASCTSTNFTPKQMGFGTFGMGFVADEPGSEAETLFVANEYGLGKLDTSSLTISPAGSFGFSAAVELTGTGHGELHGLFLGFPPYIAKLNKQTSALGVESKLHSVQVGTGFAFAFWGGSFWVFTAPDGLHSKVDRYDPMQDLTETVITTLDFKIVGAGVSTCAPVEPPK